MSNKCVPCWCMKHFPSSPQLPNQVKSKQTKPNFTPTVPLSHQHYLAPLPGLWRIELQTHHSCSHHVQPVDVNNVTSLCALVAKYSVQKTDQSHQCQVAITRNTPSVGKKTTKTLSQRQKNLTERGWGERMCDREGIECVIREEVKPEKRGWVVWGRKNAISRMKAVGKSQRDWHETAEQK